MCAGVYQKACTLITLRDTINLTDYRMNTNRRLFCGCTCVFEVGVCDTEIGILAAAGVWMMEV